LLAQAFYGPPADVWSIGILCVAMLRGMASMKGLRAKTDVAKSLVALIGHVPKDLGKRRGWDVPLTFAWAGPNPEPGFPVPIQVASTPSGQLVETTVYANYLRWDPFARPSASDLSKEGKPLVAAAASGQRVAA